LYTPEAVAAIKLFQELEHIQLEGTYSAKPIAAIMDDALHSHAVHDYGEFDNAAHDTTLSIKDKTILFWNTYCGIDFSHLTHDTDYKKLPKEFQRYFEEDVQPLAR